MYSKITLAMVLSIGLLFACKKSKTVNDPDPVEAKVSTTELTSTRSTSVYGVDVTFMVKLDGTGTGDKAIDQYGIVYKSWIGSAGDKIPTITNGATIVFAATPAAGKTIEQKATLTFTQFNDVNYRAYARLKNGTYVYGEIKYFISV